MQDIIWSIFEYILKGGVVMIPLLVLSIFMWMLIIERIIFFKELYSDDISRKEAIKILSNKVNNLQKKGLTALVIKEIQKRKRNSYIRSSIIDEAIVHIIHKLDAHLELINVMAKVAPLLGLLGTTIGMIKAFYVIAIFGTGNVKALASGISEALITTQTGLFVAIPGIYMSNFLNQRAKRLKEKTAEIGMYLVRKFNGIKY